MWLSSWRVGSEQEVGVLKTATERVWHNTSNSSPLESLQEQ